MANHQLVAIGSQVKASSNEVGFRGLWYLATIIDLRWNKGWWSTTLSVEEDKEELIKEWADVSLIGLLLPPEEEDDEDCILYEVVDGYARNGWWTGVVIRAVEGGVAKRFVVFFEDVPEEIKFDQSKLWLHHRWVDGKWVGP